MKASLFISLSPFPTVINFTFISRFVGISEFGELFPLYLFIFLLPIAHIPILETPEEVSGVILAPLAI